MNYLCVTGNPKSDGLCYAVTHAVARGAMEAGAAVDILHVDQLARCRVCGDGWGICRDQHCCAFGSDGFNEALEHIGRADALCLITPVYWGEMEESLKSFTDKLRRCSFGQSGALSGKPVLLVACAGGTGNGLLSCLEQMDRLCRHTGALPYDIIGVNRWNNDYKRAAATAAARAMAAGRPHGQTIAY